MLTRIFFFFSQTFGGEEGGGCDALFSLGSVVLYLDGREMHPL